MMSTVQKLFSEVSTYSEKLEREDIEKILKDTDVSSATNKLNRAVASRRIKIISDDIANLDSCKEIEKRLNGIKFNRIINHLVNARYYGYSAFEIIYNNEFGIDNLIPIPQKNIIFKDKKFMLKIGNSEIELNKEKFLLAIHQWNPAEPTGKSIFENINKTFLDKESYNNQLRGISKAYGDMIVIYPYDINATDEEKEKLSKNMESTHQKKTIGFPVDFGEDFDLKKSIDFIRLSDLDPEIYTKLEDREKRKILQNILGGTLTIEDSSAEGKGTNALGQVHQEGFQEVVDEICNFISDSLFQLLEIDGQFHGYNPKDYTIVLECEETEEEGLEKEKSKEELRLKKLENLEKLKNVGYVLTKEALSELLGIDSNDLTEHIVTNQIEFSSLSGKKKIQFLKEKVELNNDLLDKSLDDTVKKFSKEISSQIKEKLKKIKKASDIEEIKLDFKNLKEKLTIAYLKGLVDDSELSEVEFSEDEEIDPFNLKYEKAIEWFLKKKPTLYDDLDVIDKEIQETVFYIKRSTELETTKKLYKSLSNNLEEGGTFKDWLKDSDEVLNKTGLGDNPYYLEVVYRTNMSSAYNAGAFYNQEMNKEEKPYGLFDAVGDNRTSNICKILDGKVYPLDHEFWNNYLPPLHYNCRSRRITLSKEEVADYGYSINKTITKDVAALKDKIGNFYGNHVNGLKKSIKTKEKEIEKLGYNDDGLSLDELGALNRYISSDSYKINEKLRNSTELNDEDKYFMKYLDKALDKMPNYKGNVRRSIQFVNNDDFENFIKTHKIKDIKTFKEYLSTTAGDIYNENAQVQIYINGSTQGKNIVKYNQAEQEILYKREQKFEVQEIFQTPDGVYHYLFEEVIDE